jgi:type IV fimbrial biogenesis protein FimT
MVESGSYKALSFAAHGFTVVELMVVVVIGAILLGIAMPSLQNMIADNRLNAVTDDLASGLNLARSEAGRLNATVGLAPASGGWVAGWTVGPSGGATLRTGAMPSGYALAVSSAYASGISFDGTGRLTNTGGAQLVICHNGGPFGGGGAARMITVNPSGRVRIAQNNSSGQPVDDTNNPITGCTPS